MEKNHCSESKHCNIIVMAYEVRILIILLYFQNFSKTELILENQQTWRVENSDLKEPLEAMKKEMEHMEEM
jgi:hypothetical protein